MKSIHEYFTLKFVNSAYVSKTNICETITQMIYTLSRIHTEDI